MLDSLRSSFGDDGSGTVLSLNNFELAANLYQTENNNSYPSVSCFEEGKCSGRTESYNLS